MLLPLEVELPLKSAALVFAILAPSHAFASAQLAPAQTQVQYQSQDLKKLSIEELTQIDVTTASRRLERLSDIAAAVTVIRQDDLRRAGITTLPDALRLVTGIHAAQVFASGWAISTRGFNISTANKLLVLVDGRTVYSPVFSGVFWESQDVFLADVDRIEVIRGPGGAVWGANAVNGVINVISKSASETRGGLIRTGVGTENRGYAGARYGGTLGGGSYRVYGQFRAEDDREFVAGGSAGDDLKFGQAGFRIDSAADGGTRWSLQGDAYSARSGLLDRSDMRLAGGNVLARLDRAFSPTSKFQLQAYYDRTFRRVPAQYKGLRDTFDLDTQQQMLFGNRHHVVFGAGARVSRGDDLGDGPGFFFDPQARTSWLVSGFVQDEVAVRQDRLFVTLGGKVERNDFSGIELQPSARLRLRLNPRHTVWGAMSRAVRMPTRFDTDLRIRLPNSSNLLLTGTGDFQSENVVAYEAGYRAQPMDRMSFDLATFVNRYTDLRSQELPLAPGQPIRLANMLNARTAGAEMSAAIQLFPRMRLHASYTYLWKRFSFDLGSRDATGGASEANDPAHLWGFRTYIDLGRAAELDAMLRFASDLPSPAVPAYTELNVRLGWRVTPRFDLSVIGQNLLHDRHQEFAAGTPREYIMRGMHLRADWRF
jgi:iron complex outermembrane receptor protein